MRQPKLMITIVTTSILVLSLTQTLSAQAEGLYQKKNHCQHGKQSLHEGRNFAKNHGGLPPFLSDIALSDTQKTHIKTLVEAQQHGIKNHMQQRHALITQLISDPTPEVFDEKKAEEMANQLAALEKDAFLNRAKTGSQIFAVLTPEQRRKATENIKKHDEKMKQIKVEPANFLNSKQSFLHRIKS